MSEVTGSDTTTMAPLEEEQENFRIHAKNEIAFILRTVMDRNTLVTLYFNQGNHSILTKILDIDLQREEMIVSCSDEESLNQKALLATNPVFVTSENQVKIRFSCPSVKLVTFEERLAFCVSLPASLTRVQRRAYYRIATPDVNPLKCVIPVPGDPDNPAEVILLDISCGGISVIDQHPLINLEPGMIYEDCRIDLPETGVLQTTICVRNTFETLLKGDITCKRAGCEFMSLPEKMLILIQRYVIGLERKRRSRDSIFY